ncbi:hypothetical protein M0804_012692 [Polistes exclamans]|nr:hypothetical protein M0804_012692 [Polistes exclamans]
MRIQPNWKHGVSHRLRLYSRPLLTTNGSFYLYLPHYVTGHPIPPNPTPLIYLPTTSFS